jgi:hypothetical protein
MELRGEKLLLGHGIHIAVETVDDDYCRLVALDRLTDRVHKFAGGHFRRVDLLHLDLPGGRADFEIHA